MRTSAWGLGALALLAAGCPPRRGPATPEPGGDAATTEGGTVPGGIPDLLGGPLSSDEAAAQLLAVEANPGEAVVVLHCGFGDGWASSVPLSLADEIGDYHV